MGQFVVLKKKRGVIKGEGVGGSSNAGGGGVGGSGRVDGGGVSGSGRVGGNTGGRDEKIV